MIEIFAHGVTVHPSEEESSILVIKGFGWEGEPFELNLRPEEAKNLVWQLSFYLDDVNDEPEDMDGML